jgi:thiamine-monophosphate kinase
LLLQTGQLSLADIVTGGDDYEVLAAVAPKDAAAFAKMALDDVQTVARIGLLTAGSGLTVRNAAGETVSLQKWGWDHFS